MNTSKPGDGTVMRNERVETLARSKDEVGIPDWEPIELEPPNIRSKLPK
jgi:hypothetical protein